MSKSIDKQAKEVCIEFGWEPAQTNSKQAAEIIIKLRRMVKQLEGDVELYKSKLDVAWDHVADCEKKGDKELKKKIAEIEQLNEQNGKFSKVIGVKDDKIRILKRQIGSLVAANMQLLDAINEVRDMA